MPGRNRPRRSGITGVAGPVTPANPPGVGVQPPPSTVRPVNPSPLPTGPQPTYAPGGINAPSPVSGYHQPTQAEIDKFNAAMSAGQAGSLMGDPAMQNVDRWMQGTGQGPKGTATGATNPAQPGGFATTGPPPTPAAPGTTPNTPFTADQWQSLIEKYLPVDVPGGLSTLFPEWQQQKGVDYTSPQWQEDQNYANRFGQSSYTMNSDLENRYNKATGTAADFTNAAPGEYDTLSNYLTNNLGRLGGPGSTNAAYDEQLQRWMESSQFEEGRQAAGMREMMGSRGARYGSDIMSAEGQMRNEFGARTRAEAGSIADRLNQARLQELGITTTGLQDVGQGRERIAEAGTQRGFLAGESAAERGARLGGEEKQRGFLAGESAADRYAKAAEDERTRAFTSGESTRRGDENLTTSERQHMFDAMMRRQEAAGGAYTNATNMAWQQYLLDRLPPEIVAQMLGYSTSFNPPGSVVQ